MLDRSVRFQHSAVPADDFFNLRFPFAFDRTYLPFVMPAQSVLDQCTDIRRSDMRRVPRRHGFQLFRRNG